MSSLPQSTSVTRLPLGIRLSLGLGIGLMHLWGATLRIRATPRAQAVIASRPRGSLVFLWHNRLALALFAFHRLSPSTPLTGLVSASRDGAILAHIMHGFGIATVRGSSSRRAFTATRELLAALAAGRNAVITPDGPRGPIYQMKPGSAELAATHAPITYTLGLTVSRFSTARSWDRFIIPHPFATLTLDIASHAPGVTADQLTASLNELNPDIPQP